MRAPARGRHGRAPVPALPCRRHASGPRLLGLRSAWRPAPVSGLRLGLRLLGLRHMDARLPGSGQAGAGWKISVFCFLRSCFLFRGAAWSAVLLRRRVSFPQGECGGSVSLCKIRNFRGFLSCPQLPSIANHLHRAGRTWNSPRAHEACSALCRLVIARRRCP